MITSAVEAGGSVNVDFLLDVPAGSHRIEFYRNTATDPSGNGEVETFVEEHAGAAEGKGPGVFKVVKTQIPLEQHPPELQEVLGYDFFVVDPETGRARELSQSSGPEDSRQYWARLDDLAHDIAELLRTLEESDRVETVVAAATPEAAPKSAPVSDKGAVYLAQTSSDMREQRDSIKRELQQPIIEDPQLPLTGILTTGPGLKSRLHVL